MAGQVLLVLGMGQRQGAGWQFIAGGFHLIPGLFVDVLERLKNLVSTGTEFWLAPTSSSFPVSPFFPDGFANPWAFLRFEA